MIKIGRKPFGDKDDNEQGFFIYYSDETPDNETDVNSTVFGRVLAENGYTKTFAYRNVVISCIAVVLLALVVFFGHYLWIYRKNLPSTFCERIVTAYSQNDCEVFIEYCTNLPKVLKNKENLGSYFNQYLPKGDLKYYRVSADTEREEKYVFKSGNTKICEIVFYRMDKPTTYGIDAYRIKKFEIAPLTEYRLTSYSTFKLLLNGEEIPEKYLFGSNYTLGDIGNILEVTFTRNMYVINDVNYISDIKALDYDGQVYDTLITTTDFGYDITISCKEKEDGIKEFFEKFIYEYMYYTVKDDRKPKPLLEYVYEASPLYKDIMSYSNPDLTKYKNERVENLTIKELTYYGSGIYTCRVYADYLTEVNDETVTKKFEKTISLLNSNGRYYVLNMSDVPEVQ